MSNYFISALFLTGVSFFPISTSLAQSIVPAPDGTGTIITVNGHTYNITGGSLSSDGANLFHSFETLGLTPTEIANFLTNPQIQNILGRVTGGNPSLIEGLMRVTGGNSNLFLINPAGIIFGAGARLDLPGSFTATTSDRIGFNSGEFNAFGPNNYPNLTGNPQNLSFLSANPGVIINAGNLALKEGQNLSLIGGTVINTGTLSAPQGSITIAAVPGSHRVRISQVGIPLSLEVSLEGVTGDITPVDLARLIAAPGIQNATTLTVDADGRVFLSGSGMTVENGQVIISGQVGSPNLNLMASQAVKPINPDLLNPPTVTLFAPCQGVCNSPLRYSFIDSTIQNYQDFLYGGQPGTVNFVVTPQEQGISKITATLAGVNNVQELHIISEGNQGNFWLGGDFVSSANLGQYQQDFQAWGQSLTPTADILLYSCLTGLGTVGDRLIKEIAQGTGADIAASTNLTGNIAFGGDWLLEKSTGNIEADLAFTPSILTQYNSTLALITVNSLLDSIAVDGQITLREAINSVNSNLSINGDIVALGAYGADEIRFDPTLFNGSQSPIILGSSLGITGTIGNDLTITGIGASNVAISGNNTNRVFTISSNANITLDSLTIQNGSNITGGGINFTGNGTLNITNSTIKNNTASNGGGGISNYNSGTVNIANSAILGNSATFSGGGLNNRLPTGTVNITNSSFNNNTVSTSGSGGAIKNSGTLNIVNSQINQNTANAGGAIFNFSGALTVDNSTLSSNSANQGAAGIYLAGGQGTINNSVLDSNRTTSSGGAISLSPNTSVTINNSSLLNNTANTNGGAIYSQQANVNIANSILAGNQTNGSGGAINSGNNSNVTINNSTLDSNRTTGTAPSEGGAIFNNGNTFDVTNSTISNNFTTTTGGGIRTSTGTFNLTNTTLSGNVANSHGGGLRAVGGTININSSTIADNHSLNNGGGVSTINYGSQIVNIKNTIIANNTAANGPDVHAYSSRPVFDLGYNLIGNTSGSFGFNQTTTLRGTAAAPLDPQLAPLADNGGPTKTHALLPGSPAIDQANTTSTTDQRGFIRLNQADIGAFEFGALDPNPQPTPVPIVTPTPAPVTVNPPVIIEGDGINDLVTIPVNDPICQTNNSNSSTLTGCDRNYQNNIASFDNNPSPTIANEQKVNALETEFTSDFEGYLGTESKPTATVGEMQDRLQDIESKTGIKPALIYVFFQPKTPAQTAPPNTVLWQYNNRRLSGEKPQRPPQEPTDELELILVTGRDEVLRYQVPEATRNKVMAIVEEFRRSVTNIRRQDAYLIPSQKLYQWIVAPLEADLQKRGITNLTFILDRGLRSLPFAALHDTKGFIIERYSVGLMPSFSLTQTEYRDIRQGRVLAMGAEEFKDNKPLPAVPVELQTIAGNLWQGESFINEGFTLANLQRARSEHPYNIIHLATHGEFKAGKPENSYIELWQSKLALNRLAELKLNDPVIDLLVLSACRTALGDEEAELGFAGLAVLAGVKSALGSLWYVNDEGTLGLMTGFYQQLQTAPIKAEALRQAQLALLHGDIHLEGGKLVTPKGSFPVTPELEALGDRTLSHPYYWSAFTAIGSPW